MLSIRRVCLSAAVLTCAAIQPSIAQYNVFASGGVVYTDVIVNGQPQTLQSVRNFELTCGVRPTAGRWWLADNGLVGPIGGSAVYDVSRCRPLSTNNGSSKGEKCFFFSGGSTCSGPGWRTVN